jgi:hypothetical protein
MPAPDALREYEAPPADVAAMHTHDTGDAAAGEIWSAIAGAVAMRETEQCRLPRSKRPSSTT